MKTSPWESTMIRRLIVLSLLVVPQMSLADDTAPPPEPSAMRPIFNGRDLTGWDGDPRLWSVRDGAIHGETTDENPAHGNTFSSGREARPRISTCGCRSA
jgi:hypothetical protein